MGKRKTRFDFGFDSKFLFSLPSSICVVEDLGEKTAGISDDLSGWQ